MRQRQTFLLTVITSETGEASFCGKIKVIATGNSYNFSSLEELNALINSFLLEESALLKFSGSSLQYPIAPDALAAS
jgi:hypothetical protein